MELTEQNSIMFALNRPRRLRKFIPVPAVEPLPKSKPATNLSGRFGENMAVKYLIDHGYRIIARNFRLKYGEIDIIALKDRETIFFEVKTRWSKKFGLPEEAVGNRKLYKIKRLAEYFAALHPELPQKLSIKVIALEIAKGYLKSLRIITVD